MDFSTQDHDKDVKNTAGPGSVTRPSGHYQSLVSPPLTLPLSPGACDGGCGKQCVEAGGRWEAAAPLCLSPWAWQQGMGLGGRKGWTRRLDRVREWAELWRRGP